MLKKKYYFGDKELFEAEEAIRKFVLNNADSVRLTLVEWSEGKGNGFSMGLKTSNIQPDLAKGLLQISSKYAKKGTTKKFGGYNDKKFIKILKNLEKDLIKNLKNNIGYDGKRKGVHLQHYLYRLSDKMKRLLNKETLIFNHYNPSSKFYGFEDPIFYKKGEMIVSVISHPIIYLYLTPALKEKFEKTERLSLKNYRL